MSDLFWLTDAQMARLEPFFPKSHGKARVDDRRVLSGIIFINRNDLHWRGRLMGRTKGGLNTKLHAICDGQGRPLNLFATSGQVSDYIEARALVNSLTKVDWLLGDRGYDADWFRDALKDKGIRACIPGRKQWKKPVKYDKRRYNRRNRIEIIFGSLKDWRRAETRYDRCPKVFFSAIALTANVIYWL
ncbi:MULTISPECIES: IS5 family transposase [unclassified Ruegeria]|uniref:IS5 family transposase n=1 Tax=unclassified Ruegeria TaxID=2625375 RepID=UPI001488F45F|nr:MULTISPECIES: IS5 family transposase [unclassified Ruegeria]NOD62821.1 IS5 family transposase [Ruegeria sp. HKCCD6109]